MEPGTYRRVAPVLDFDAALHDAGRSLVTMLERAVFPAPPKNPARARLRLHLFFLRLVVDACRSQPCSIHVYLNAKTLRAFCLKGVDSLARHVMATEARDELPRDVAPFCTPDSHAVLAVFVGRAHGYVCVPRECGRCPSANAAVHCLPACAAADTGPMRDLGDEDLWRELSSKLARACARDGCAAAASHSCGGCRTAHYCSRDCQKADWARHKSLCPKHKALPAVAEDRAGCLFWPARA